MKRILAAAILAAAMSAPAMADGSGDLLSALFGGMDENKERQKRYERRYEIMMVRDAKQGKIPQLRPVDSPVAPDAQMATVVPVVAVTPIVSNDAGCADGKVSVVVESLVYDEAAGNGVLKVSVAGGSFKAVNDYIRANIGRLVRIDAPGEDAPKVPPDAKLAIKSIVIDENNICEVIFTAK